MARKFTQQFCAHDKLLFALFMMQMIIHRLTIQLTKHDRKIALFYVSIFSSIADKSGRAI